MGRLFYLNRSTAGTGARCSIRRRTSRADSKPDVTTSGGQPVYVEREYRFLQIDRSATGLISYPFSRALRVEATGGFRQIGFKQDLTDADLHRQRPGSS